MDREIELRLAARLKAGDASAFEAIYEAYRPRLFSFLVRLSRRRDVAEDLLEETWLRLVGRAETLADGARLGPWLFAVARNLYFSWRRSRALDPARTTELDPAWPAPDRGDSPFEAAARGELERKVEAALARLSSSDRELVLLVGVEGLTPAEVAGICGLPAVTVRARLHRARERLAVEISAGPVVPRAGGVRDMAIWEPGDAVDEALRTLRPHDVPDERAERIRARCVAALASRRLRPAPRGEAPAAAWRVWLEPAFALGLGALYLAEAVVRALAVYR